MKREMNNPSVWNSITRWTWAVVSPGGQACRYHCCHDDMMCYKKVTVEELIDVSFKGEQCRSKRAR